MDINRIFQSKIFQGIIIGSLGLIAVLAIFKMGWIVGARKADFSCRWSDNYHNNFGGPKKGFALGFNEADFIEANGVFGKIIKIELSPVEEGIGTVVVKGARDVEKIVVVKNDSTIKFLQDNKKINDLNVDDFIVVIGEPNDAGQIEAKLIRILPPPPAGKNNGSFLFNKRQFPL